MLSLADLRARQIQPTWQEAVAVVQELIATVLAAGGSPQWPDVASVALIPNGDVVALPGEVTREHPVRHLAILLQLLTEGTAAPPELEAFVQKNLFDPPQYATVEEFARALEFYERPGRREDIERLVARAEGVEARSSSDDELKRLRARAAAAASRPKPEKEPTGERSRRRVRPLVVALAVLIVAAAAGAGLWWWGQFWSKAPATAGTEVASAEAGEPAKAPPSLLARTSDAASRAVGAVVDALKGTAAPAKPAEPAPPAPAPPPEAKPRPRPPALKSTAPAVGAAPAVAVPVTVATGAAPATAAATAEPVPAPVDPPPVDNTVYDVSSPHVEPPVLVRPVLPSVPPRGVPPDQVGLVEVLVDAKGHVVEAKLLAPSPRFEERMIVSNAKTWIFRPATKDGQPVSYRVRIRLTL